MIAINELLERRSLEELAGSIREFIPRINAMIPMEAGGVFGFSAEKKIDGFRKTPISSRRKLKKARGKLAWK